MRVIQHQNEYLHLMKSLLKHRTHLSLVFLNFLFQIALIILFYFRPLIVIPSESAVELRKDTSLSKKEKTKKEERYDVGFLLVVISLSTLLFFTLFINMSSITTFVVMTLTSALLGILLSFFKGTDTSNAIEITLQGLLGIFGIFFFVSASFFWTSYAKNASYVLFIFYILLIGLFAYLMPLYNDSSVFVPYSVSLLIFMAVFIMYDIPNVVKEERGLAGSVAKMTVAFYLDFLSILHRLIKSMVQNK